MQRSARQQRRYLKTLDRAAIEAHQLARLNALLDAILPANHFYAEKLAAVRRPVGSLAEMADWPFTFKEELIPSQGAEIAAHHTWPLESYFRLHQTSGTRGRPLTILDTADDWRWFCNCWQYVLDEVDVSQHDAALLAFSFGPFIAFWGAHTALSDRGCLIAPGGGLSTLSRLELLRVSRATLVFCTPTYALHMAEVAAQHQIDLAAMHVRCLILAGEPGGSVQAIRQRLTAAWNARVLDHAGASEVGPWGVGDDEGHYMQVLESEFIPEFLAVDSGKPAASGELSELVLTGLGRTGCPVIRYRTGDLVRPVWHDRDECKFVKLAGGVLGRSDDMLIVRGINIFPSAVEQVLRGFPEIVEYRMLATKESEMDQLAVEIEDRLELPQRVAEELRVRLGLRIEVRCVPLGSLPRFEAKGGRFIDQRHCN